MVDTLIIPATIILLGGLLSWFVIETRGKWILKLLTVSLAVYMGLGVWSVVDDLKGWPTTAELPQKFRLHWIIIKEPCEQTNNEGAIFLLAEDYHYTEADFKFFQHSISKDTPRWYKIPYELQKHKDGQDLLTKLRQGKAIILERGKRKDGEGGADGTGGGGNGTGGNSEGTGDGAGSTSFGYVLPPPKPKPK